MYQRLTYLLVCLFQLINLFFFYTRKINKNKSIEFSQIMFLLILFKAPFEEFVPQRNNYSHYKKKVGKNMKHQLYFS